MFIAQILVQVALAQNTPAQDETPVLTLIVEGGRVASTLPAPASGAVAPAGPTITAFLSHATPGGTTPQRPGRVDLVLPDRGTVVHFQQQSRTLPGVSRQNRIYRPPGTPPRRLM